MPMAWTRVTIADLPMAARIRTGYIIQQGTTETLTATLYVDNVNNAGK